MPENAGAKTIAAAADDLEKKLVAVREDLINLTISANEDSLAYPPQLDAKLAYLAMDVGTADSAPTEAEQQEFEKLKRQSGELLARWEDLQRRDLAAFQKLAAEGSLSTVVVPPGGPLGRGTGSGALIRLPSRSAGRVLLAQRLSPGLLHYRVTSITSVPLRWHCCALFGSWARCYCADRDECSSPEDQKRSRSELGVSMKMMHLCYAAIGFAVARWIFRRQPVADPVTRFRSQGLL